VCLSPLVFIFFGCVRAPVELLAWEAKCLICCDEGL